MLIGRLGWRLSFVVIGAVYWTWIARVVRVSPMRHGHDFWRREGGRFIATPLFVALIVIETTDIVFALDSVPAPLRDIAVTSGCAADYDGWLLGGAA